MRQCPSHFRHRSILEINKLGLKNAQKCVKDGVHWVHCGTYQLPTCSQLAESHVEAFALPRCPSWHPSAPQGSTGGTAEAENPYFLLSSNWIHTPSYNSLWVNYDKLNLVASSCARFSHNRFICGSILGLDRGFPCQEDQNPGSVKEIRWNRTFQVPSKWLMTINYQH